MAAPAAQAVDIPVTNLSDNSPGSLRAAIVAANGTAAADNIVFQSGLSGQITLTSGEIAITRPLTISGPGANVLTVSGNDNSRVFSVNLATAGQAVTVSGLTLADGFSIRGGAVSNGNANLTLIDSAVVDSALDPAMAVGGGGISTFAPLRVERSTVSGNTAVSEVSGGGYGGGIYATGGATSAVVIVNSTISGNQASEIGGVFQLANSPLTITSSTIADNDADAFGAAHSTFAPVTIQSSILADNEPSDFTVPGGNMSPQNVGFSLIEDTAVTFTTTGPNIIGVDPQLDALGPHGGPTDTQAPAASSPAIDKGSSPGLTSDQRNQPRIVDFASIGNAAGGDGSDIGALERDLLTPGPGPIVGQENAGRQCLGERATIVGTKGKDKLRGTSGPDVISGKRGNDTIIGLEGDDLLCGDKGNDRIKGGGGNDSARGGNGADTIRGSAGDDTLRGGSEADSIFGEAGNDALFGGSKAGKGSAAGGDPASANLCDGGEGTDTATGCENVSGVP